MNARCGGYCMVGTNRFVRTIMMVAASKWVRLVQLIDTIEIVTAGKATDESFHSCFAGDGGISFWWDKLGGRDGRERIKREWEVGMRARV